MKTIKSKAEALDHLTANKDILKTSNKAEEKIGDLRAKKETTLVVLLPISMSCSKSSTQPIPNPKSH